MYKESNITFKGINKLAIPAIISGIAEPLLSITDTAIVGNINLNPTEALAAVGIAGSFISALIWILAQTRSAISAIVGKYLGAKKLDEIATLPAQIIAINLSLSIVIYIVTLFFVDQIFQMYNADGLILNYAVDYYKIRAIGFPLTLFVFSAFGVFRGLQNTYWPMIISITGAVLNVVLDIVLVYGIEGIIAPMNVEGAAWASVIAQAVMAIFALILLFKKTPFSYKLQFPFNKEIKNLLSISFNLIIRAVALNIALYLANSYATKYGNNYIAAQTIAFQIWLFFAFFIDGYASVGSIVSGKLLGEKNYPKLWELSGRLSKYSIIVALILAVVCAIFYTQIGTLFSKEQEVLEAFYDIFWIVLLMQPINAVAFVFDGIFKGLAEAVTLRNLLLVATFFGFIPTLLIGDYFSLRLYAIWMAFTVWMLLRSGILVVKFRRKYLHKNM
ncbi:MULTISPECIES: MATE family efflux transporter [Flavobacteriaceae]|uniref:Multidrug-efflux transporter n=2 Tax=Flavobacteriaceae TaxID=49546 RepID=A0A4Y8AT47_9FLAO|nr:MULTISPECIES: MATE family efflux transporter [Flavobacteriaceae]TEW73836.1 MATE family efflux transporter [Gramella jeungdoensis]GGK38013.1 MATE family efflux transporter [Lutibacter litoralis]